MVRYAGSRLFLVGLFFVALILRFLFFHIFLADNPCQLMYDAAHYHGPALNIAHGDGFTMMGKPYFYRFPGYSTFLAGCYTLFGIDVQKALYVQIIIAACIPLLIFFIARLFFPQQKLVWYSAALLAAIHPGYLIFSGLVMTETLFVVFFSLFIYLFFLACKRDRIFFLFFLAGLALGCATYMRPIGHYFVILASFMLLFGHQSLSNKIKGIIGLIAGWSMMVIPWILRNYYITGYVFLHTLGGPHFMNHTAIPLVMKTQHVSWQDARKQVYGELEALVAAKALAMGRQVLEIEESLLAETLATSYMQKNVCHTGKHALQNAFKTVFSLYSSELLVIDAHGDLPNYQERSLIEKIKRFLWPDLQNKLIIAVIYYELLLFIFLLIGFLGFLYRWCFKEKSHREWWLSILFMALFVGLSISCGFARLRLPYEVFMLIFASYCWVGYFNSSSGKQASLVSSSGTLESS